MLKGLFYFVTLMPGFWIQG